MSQDIVYSVTAITERIKQLIRDSFDHVRIQGEIADFTHYQASGHMYFSLADENARLSGVMFRRANEDLDFQPEEGMTVVVEGRLDVYEERGNYQIIVESMVREGLGELERQFRELKAKLESEGALAEERKRPLPPFPATIGVVTSGDGAAFWDIVRTIQQRCPVVRIVLYPSRVNGKEAAEDIAHGVRRLPELLDLDCLIVGRGGGSPEDLWGFNTEPVARALLECPVPVISAVGHEVDVTISDLVADHRSPTPTAAGEQVVPSVRELKDRLFELRRRVRSAYRDQIDRRRDRVRFISEKPVFARAEGWLQRFRDHFERERDRLRDRYRFYLSERKGRLERLTHQLLALNPENVLNRGYAIVRRGQKLVTGVENVRARDEMTVQWSDGEADVTVDRVRSDEDESGGT